MNPALRHRLRLLRRVLWMALAVVLVLMALAAGITSQLLPLVERHPDRVALWLGERAGHTIRFDRLETAWTRRGPLLRLDGLRIGDGPDAVQVGAAEILVAQYAGLLPGRSLTELRLRDLALTLERDDDGRWNVRGLPGQRQDDGDPFAALERLGELQVIGGSLTVLAPGLDIEATVPRIDLRLQVDGRRVRAGARVWMREDDRPALAVFDLARGSGDGRAYAGLRQADLDGWSALLRYAGIAAESGHGRAEAWATLRDYRIGRVRIETALEDVGLYAAHAQDADAKPARVSFERIDASLRWQALDDGWRLDAPRLRIAGGGSAQSLDGLLVAAGARYAFAAERIEAGPLLALLPLSDRVPAGLRDWLQAAAPSAVLAGVELAGLRGGELRLQGRVEALGFAAVGDVPGLTGLRGDVQADARGAVFDFDPQARMRFDWPSGFGAPHEIAVRGTVAAWREAGDWLAQSPALRIDGEGYGADVRGGLRFPEDGGRPRIDLAARLDEARVPIAKRFWVRYQMPDAAVDWLDAALAGGTVRDGRAVASGDLADWPFDAEDGRDKRGLFHAEGELVDAVVKFQPDWPAAERLNGRVRFIANGFDFRGSAAIAGVEAAGLEAGISDFEHAELEVSARSRADAGRLLALLRDSPLREQAGEALEGVSASGPTMGRFAMTLPLHDGDNGPRIDGAVELAGLKLGESEWALALDDVRGELRYDHHGFTAADLRASREGSPGMLTLRAGEGHVRDRAQAFEAQLRLDLGAGELIARAPELDWLRPYVSGGSTWTIGVWVPQAGTTSSPTRLQLQSDLAGTELRLPAPLDKPAAIGLPTRIEAMLPLERGEVSVRMGERMSLRARTGNGATGASVALGGAAAAVPPASGLDISGRTPALAAMDWAAVAGGDGEGLPLRRIDLVVDRLLLFGGVFSDTRIQGAATASATQVRFEGEALAGSLSLPQAEGAAVTAQLQRLHWRGAPPDDGTEAADAEEAPDTDSGTDPGRIPPIHLAVDDLRVNDAALGRASLRTQPVAGGLRIEQLQTRSPGQRIDASGDWSGRGASEHTRLKVDITSRDFGALLAGLGQDGRIRGGDGELRLDAAWSGSPARFRAEALEGTLALTVKDGQLVEIEPGAGRVLGLLSIAELPRRLSLDFRDFFNKGFAFNRIGGEVRFGGGQARSDDLVIDGPAAQIRIRGSADLRAQTYDQTIDVHPKSGNLLTAVGAIAAGPVGAAVGAVANAVLRKPLGEIGATTYRVTGPWKEPKVEVIRREPPPPVAERERTVPAGG